MMKDSSFRFTRITESPKERFFNIYQHFSYELVCIIEGSLNLTIDFQNFELKENTVYLIKPGQIHQWSKQDFPNKCIACIFHFSKDFLPSYEMVNKLFDNNTLPIIEIPPLIMNDISKLTLMIEKCTTHFKKLKNAV